MQALRAQTILSNPSVDIAELSDQLGRAWGVTCGESLPQYLAWSERSGLLDALAERPLTLAELAWHTPLSERGLDALVPILASLRLVRPGAAGIYELTSLAREYLVPSSQYYVGPALYWDCEKPIPNGYLRERSTGPEPARRTWPPSHQLEIPRVRNLAPSVAAVRTGEFHGLTHLVDVGGGSGAFAIPLALDYPHVRITLVELPDNLDRVRTSLAAHGVEHRVQLVGLDVFAGRWRFGVCDGIYFGNVFHGYGDDRCRYLARQSFASLRPGGRLWIHELLFDEAKDGPLLAALWNANLIARSSEGRQRRASELVSILEGSGFNHYRVIPTAGRFSLVSGRKSTV